MIHTEKAFEEAIEKSLIENGGYIKGNPADFSRELALDRKNLFDFLRESQPENWKKSETYHGAEAEKKVLQRLYKELDNRGALDVLRNGFTDYGVKYKMAFFQPVSGLNPETQRLYELNRLTVTRQVKYSKKNEKSIDMVLSLNGLPFATIELKNLFTGQDVNNAKKQYIEDRDPRELLFQFKKRALVHFAVDTDQVYMTTRLEKENTRYLPFNKGYNKGKGNPPNPNGCKTAYLWEEILKKDSIMDILGRFMHLQIETYTVDGTSYKKEKMLFPRFHQLDCVRKLIADVEDNGSGKNYLIEHSAGSGKSNSIAWLAHRLSNLHNNKDEKIFNSVIVVTDRRVLDKQLQDTIYQFDHKMGVVQKIDKNSNQLAEALKSGTPIIITTLQKFPFVIDKVGELKSSNYAVIIDEAHSSQGGEASKDLKRVLTLSNLDKAAEEDKEESETGEDKIRDLMDARGPQTNLSFFAFTATPKQKTLEVFGIKNSDGKPAPFHLYSMRQAIEENFIMDVLENYTTYKTFFKLSKEIEDDPKLNKKKAKRAIARFVSLHPYNLAQKTEVIIEHFRNFTMKKIGGRAKAMVVTSSRPHVVRYKHEFDRYIKEKGYKEIKALVAFTAFTDEDGISWTEADINKFGEKELPEKFNTPEYQLLLVAEKYQTGFDQPLLHTMYVDKKLSNVRAVQTLSRLNRIYPGKEDTFILDFVNERDDILKAFQPYYEETIAEATDPNILYDLKSKLEGTQIFWQSEIDSFCKIFFKSMEYHTKKEHAQLNACIDPAVDRYNAIDEEEKQEDFKHNLATFLRVYSFLTQIIPFQDIDLEKFYAFGRFLLKKIPKRDMSDKLKISDEVALEYYRLQKMSEGEISLQKNETGELQPITEAGQRSTKKEFASLSEIIEILNDRFGTDFTDADKLFFEQIKETMLQDEKLESQAINNSIDNFKYGFKEAFLNKVIERMEQNEDIVAKIMDNISFRDVVEDWMLNEVYHSFSKRNVGRV